MSVYVCLSSCICFRTGSFRHWFDGQMVLVVMAACAGAYAWGFLPQGAGGWGVYDPQCQRAVDSQSSQEVRGMMEGKEKRGRLRDGRMNGEREGVKVVSCKILEEHLLLSPWICSWMKKAVKYVFHSSLILCHNKRIKEYCLRNLRCSRNGSLSSDDLRYCSVVFFKCKTGVGGGRGGS